MEDKSMIIKVRLNKMQRQVNKTCPIFVYWKKKWVKIRWKFPRLQPQTKLQNLPWITFCHMLSLLLSFWAYYSLKQSLSAKCRTHTSHHRPKIVIRQYKIVVSANFLKGIQMNVFIVIWIVKFANGNNANDSLQGDPNMYDYYSNNI